VATGIEELASRDSGRLIVAEVSGKITYVDGRKIIVEDDKKKNIFILLLIFQELITFLFSSASKC
jgi:DNA-directed RNA polymerase subunit beta